MNARVERIAFSCAEKYDFDRKEVLSFSQMSDNEIIALYAAYDYKSSAAFDARPARHYEVIMRLWCSDEKVESIIRAASDDDDVEMQRDYLSSGSRLRVITTDSIVVHEEFLGLQLL